MRWTQLGIAVLVSAALLGVGMGAMAQGVPVRIVQGADGTLYVLKGGARYAIAADAIDDEELAGYSDGGTLAGNDVLALLGFPQSPPVETAAAPAASRADTQDMQDTQQQPTSQAATPADTAQATTPAEEGSRGAAKTSASGVDQSQDQANQQPQPPGGTPRRGVPQATPAPGSRVAAPQFITVQGAAPGGTATVRVQAQPGVSCTLSYRTPAGTPSTAAGLGDQTADATGVLTWTFTIGGDTKTGLGTLSAMCGNVVTNNTIQIGTPALSR